MRRRSRVPSSTYLLIGIAVIALLVMYILQMFMEPAQTSTIENKSPNPKIQQKEKNKYRLDKKEPKIELR